MVEEGECNLICVFGQITLLILYMITFYLGDEIENECPKMMHFIFSASSHYS